MRILNSHEQQFIFLGSRNYVQGSSLTYGLVEAANCWRLGDIHRIQANIRSLLKEHGRYELYPDKAETAPFAKTCNAVFHLTCESGPYIVVLKGTGEYVTARRPYDEERLIEGHFVSAGDKSVKLEVTPDAPLMNIFIALNKRLVGALFPAAGYGQWFLSRYDLAWNATRINEFDVLMIRLIGNIGMQHTQSSIELGRNAIGSIYFSRIKE